MTTSASKKPADSSDDQPATSPGSPGTDASPAPTSEPAPGTSTGGPSTDSAPLGLDEAARRLSAHRGMKVLVETPAEVALAEGEEDLSGLYELVCLQWDEPYVVLMTHPATGATVEEERFRRHRKGDLIELEHAQAKRLLVSDAIVVPGVRELAEAEAAEARATAAAHAAKEARARAAQMRRTLDDRKTVLEQWKEGAELGAQARAENAAKAKAAWEARPQTIEDVLGTGEPL